MGSDDLTGRVAFITGAAHGIGRATAKLLAVRGATVALADLNEDGLQATAQDCRAAGADVATMALDIRSSHVVGSVLDETQARFGRVDILANIAGIFPFASIEDTPDELWDDIIATNLTGTFYCCRAVLPIMKEQRSGSIVNVASGAAFRGLPKLSAYGASKAGVIAFSRALAVEAAPHVRVNVVAPGPVNTQDDTLERPTDAPDAARALNDVPLGRMGRPDEIAEMIAFLASERASYVHGQVLHVNGGRLMP